MLRHVRELHQTLNMRRYMRCGVYIVVASSAMLLFTALLLTFINIRREMWGAELASNSELATRHFSAGIESIDATLFHIASEIQRKPDLIESFPAQALDAYRNFLTMKESLELRIADREGNIFIGTNMKGQANVADRAYFRSLRENPKPALIVEGPVRSRTRKGLVIVLARPIANADGKFLGVVIAGVDWSYFHNLSHELRTAKSDRILVAIKGESTVIFYDSSNRKMESESVVQNLQSKFLNLTHSIDMSDLTEHRLEKLTHTPSLWQFFVNKAPGVSGSWLKSAPILVLQVDSSDTALESLIRTSLLSVLAGSVTFLIGFFVLRLYLRNVEIAANQQLELTRGAKFVALGEMASGIAHEINNPLAVISGTARQIRRLCAKPNFDILELVKYTEKIESTTERAAKIIRGLKTFSRESKGDPKLKSDFRTILDETLELCQSRLQSAGIKLTCTCPENAFIMARAAQISQVVLNLLNNAHDAIKDSPNPWIELKAVKKQSTLEVSVTDSGNGIPKEILQKIMQPFFTTKPVGKGTGLGLSISKGIIEDHNGVLSVDAACPNTRFIINLPLAIDSEQLETRKDAA